MRLTTIRTAQGSAVARIEGDDLVRLPFPDLLALLAQPDWRSLAAADGDRNSREGAELDALVRPPKTFCLGLNYKRHIQELGFETPEYPLVFAKFPDALLGPNDDIVVPTVSRRVDPEPELVAVIGRPAHRIGESEALDHVAGYTVANDISMRDWQTRTTEMLLGKTFEASTPVGPVLVTPDEIDHGADLDVTSEIDGVVYQQGRTSDLLFGVAHTISYLSQMTTLRPGDLLLTGTPGKVPDAALPNGLEPGQVVTATVEGIGSCVNRMVEDPYR